MRQGGKERNRNCHMAPPSLFSIQKTRSYKMIRYAILLLLPSSGLASRQMQLIDRQSYNRDVSNNDRHRTHIRTKAKSRTDHQRLTTPQHRVPDLDFVYRYDYSELHTASVMGIRQRTQPQKNQERGLKSTFLLCDDRMLLQDLIIKLTLFVSLRRTSRWRRQKQWQWWKR